MPIDLAKFQELKDGVALAKADADKATGAYEAALKRLASTHGLPNLKAAKARLAELEVDVKEAEDAYNDELVAFETKWSDFQSPEDSE